MVISDEALLKLAVAVAGGAISTAIATVGHLLKRAIDGLDHKLDQLVATGNDHEGRIVRIETHLGIGTHDSGPRPHTSIPR